MNKYRKHIDDFFREKLGKYTETPPADVWESLDARLDTLTPPTAPGGTGGAYKWLWHMGMVSLITVLSVSIGKKYFGNAGGGEAPNTSTAEQSTISQETASNNNATADTKAGTTVAETAAATNNSATTANNSTGNYPATNSNGAQAINAAAATTADNKATPGSNIAGAQAKATAGSNGKPIAVNAHYTGKLSNVSNLYAHNNQVSQPAKGNRTVDIYNSASNSNNEQIGTPAQEEVTQAAQAINAPATTITENKTTIKPATANKKDTTELNSKKATKAPADKTKPKLPAIVRWEAGIKGGYERGFDNAAATKFVIAPYVQYNLSPKVAIMTQPAVKFAKTNTTAIGQNEQYYQANTDGKVTTVSSNVIVKVEGTVVNTYYHNQYNYTQTHDSIVKSNTYGGSYMEYELPILLKYNLSAKAAVYGGVNIIYTQTKGVTEHTYNKKGILTSIDTTIVSREQSSAPPLTDIITYTGKPYSNYAGPLYPAAQESQVRLGGMLGFSYQYSKKISLDALIQQNPAKADTRGGYNINTPLSSTYFRVSVGYKITK